MDMNAPATTSSNPIATLFRCRPGEGWALALSFCYFTLLLASYYMVRPVRDALGATLGAGNIKYLASLVFLTMLAIVPIFGWLVARVRRRILVPAVYGFFVTNLVVFALLFRGDPENATVARVFYVWVTVFNVFVVSVFWSFMADLWREEQGRRLFGLIASGGSLGGLLGPVLTRRIVEDLGLPGVVVLAASFLAGTILAIVLLERSTQGRAATAVARIDEPVGGAILAGLSRLARSPFLVGIAALVIVGNLLGMIVYIELARFAGTEFSTPAERTAFYSQRDLWVNALALVFQFVIVGRLTTWFGVRTTLALTALLAVVCFVGLGMAPMLGALIVVNVALRSTEFGVAKPARDMLYTVVDAETKYKVKNVIDTAVYRGSDTASSWAHGAIAGLGVGLKGFAWLSVVLALGYVALAWAVGTGYKRRGGV
jgi:AAA family ATP:ADP antiporter